MYVIFNIKIINQRRRFLFFCLVNRLVKMTSSINVFSVLSTSADTSEFSVVQKVSGKKVDKKKKAPIKIDTLKNEMADFEYDHPVGVILFHYKGKDQFLVFNFRFSHAFWIELSACSVKKITLPIIETILNEKAKRLSNCVVWESYFESETLRRLTKQEYYETPSEFEITFDLVRGGPITKISYSPAILFDFRGSNSKQEFMYLPNGSRVYFGKAYDDFRIEKNRDKLERIMKHYDRSLEYFDFDEACDARDKIFKLTGKNPDYTKDREYADEAFRVIAKYVHLYNRDEQVELRNLLPFKNWIDDLKIEYERAKEYYHNLLKLSETIEKEISEIRERRQKAHELQDEEAYPSF